MHFTHGTHSGILRGSEILTLKGGGGGGGGRTLYPLWDPDGYRALFLRGCTSISRSF